MRTALALVAVLGLMAAGVAVSQPPKAKKRIKAQPVANLNVPPAAAPEIDWGPYPPGGPVSPRGWIVQWPGGSIAIPHTVKYGFIPSPAGPQPALLETDAGLVGGQFGTAMHGSNAGSNPFVSPIDTKNVSWIKVIVNGPSEVHLPGRSGFGMGPSTPTGSFTLSGGITVTAVP